ncbi:MAG TPA: hypothetical protein VGK73_03690 [Polyangiaceae bacterium]
MKPVPRTAKAKSRGKSRAAKPKEAQAKPKASAKPRLTLVPAPKQAALRATPPSRRRSKSSEQRPSAKSTPPPKLRKKPLTPEEQARTAYDSEVLSVLRDEFPIDDRAASDDKIRRRLRDKSLGAFDVQRVATLRRLKDQLQTELSSGPKSGHFTGTHGLYANPEDFDHAELIRDYWEAYPTVSPEAIAGFVPLAVYLYYLR